MTRTRRRDRVIFSLAGLASLQLLLLGARLGNEMGGSSSWLKTGDRLAGIRVGAFSGGGGARSFLRARGWDLELVVTE